jgi:hypothetical protein
MSDEPRDPETPEEWQDAVDAADFCLALDAAIQFGLVRYDGGAINVQRAVDILARGKARGYLPKREP